MISDLRDQLVYLVQRESQGQQDRLDLVHPVRLVQLGLKVLQVHLVAPLVLRVHLVQQGLRVHQVVLGLRVHQVFKDRSVLLE